MDTKGYFSLSFKNIPVVSHFCLKKMSKTISNKLHSKYHPSFLWVKCTHKTLLTDQIFHIAASISTKCISQIPVWNYSQSAWEGSVINLLLTHPALRTRRVLSSEININQSIYKYLIYQKYNSEILPLSFYYTRNWQQPRYPATTGILINSVIN